jgi:ribosomal protein L22
MDLKVVLATVDEGFSFRRFKASGRGRVGSITRQNSHITVAVAAAA